MATIEFDGVDLNYPVYGSHGMSLRSNLVRIAAGGKIERDSRATIIKALDNVSFTLHEGDAVGLIGHNGAGKSTLLRAMAGIYPPSRGRIFRNGKTANIFDIGAGLDLELTGYENIIHLGMFMGLNYGGAKELIPDVEDFTELGDFLNLPIRTYSSGMVMRLMFATATALTPEILLLDEMFSAGDEAFRQKSHQRIKNLIERAKIFVFASHDIGLIKKYCNRAFRLEHGKLEEVSVEKIA